MNGICNREAVPVEIGQLTLYCESFRAAASAVLYEQPTVVGRTLVTNKYVKAARLTLTGRIYCGSGAAEVLAELDNMSGAEVGDVVYRGVSYPDCIVQSSAAEDRGDDMLYVTVTLAATSSAEPAEGRV